MTSVFDSITGSIVGGSPAPADLVTMPRTTSPNDILGKVAQGAVDYYGVLNQVNAAKYNSKLLKAQAQGAVAAAKGAGATAYQVGAAGLPSPTLLLAAGAALAALVILKR